MSERPFSEGRRQFLHMAMGGFALVWKAMRGAVPTLAPGALVQLGLLGLIWAYDHPATRARATTDEERR